MPRQFYAFLRLKRGGKQEVGTGWRWGAHKNGYSGLAWGLTHVCAGSK